MEAWGAGPLLPEDEHLLLPCPHAWALVPRAASDSSVPSLRSWVARVFSGPALASTVNFQPPFFLLEVGWLDLVVFFPLIYLSPGAGFLISSGQTGWHIPAVAQPPVTFVTVFGEVRMFNHLPTFFFFLKEGGKKIAHSTQFSARFRLKLSMLGRGLVIGFPQKRPAV